jgi:GT2 family glycosyltransferase
MLSKSDDEVLAALVLSFNKREHTLRCLESIGRQTYPVHHVIVVDNGSADGTADAIARHFPRIHLLRSEANLGAAGGRNYGIRWANEHVPYTWLLFLDDDTVADARMAQELMAEMRRHPDAGMVTPKGYRGGTSHVIASAGGMRVRLGLGSIRDIGAGQPDVGQFAEPGTVDACVGFAVLARREALARAGNFDESYNPYGWEEVDLSLRIRQAGYTIRYAPLATCWHAGGTPGRGYRVFAYERGKVVNYLRLMTRHAGIRDWLSFLALLPFRALGLLGAQQSSVLGRYRREGASRS